ncbi:hypothetical protein F2Q69_00050033 [Brassica cretica]|uniref:Uncharacterized protein n=1 Tax=Brassica cretica TaxID=69181 RepID=A0A8S9PY87_BRACR|nr:hypothetical protein F2Q69_00050033 [Brassica cretica]
MYTSGTCYPGGSILFPLFSLQIFHRGRVEVNLFCSRFFPAPFPFVGFCLWEAVASKALASPAFASRVSAVTAVLFSVAVHRKVFAVAELRRIAFLASEGRKGSSS